MWHRRSHAKTCQFSPVFRHCQFRLKPVFQLSGCEQGQIATYVLKEPVVLGHETAGWGCTHERCIGCIPMSPAGKGVHVCRDVVAVGSNVTSLQVGDRVAVEPGVPCWGNYMAR